MNDSLLDDYICEYQMRIQRQREGLKHLDSADKRQVITLNYAYQEFIQALRRIENENY